MLGFLRTSVNELGQSIVMVTHDPHGASYADRVVFLADGKVVGDLLAHAGHRARADEAAGGLTCGKSP